jgi:hypothetical protein
MGFSQEVVQEFQMSTVNFDLSTGVTASGAVNIITRSGENELHINPVDRCCLTTRPTLAPRSRPTTTGV